MEPESLAEWCQSLGEEACLHILRVARYGATARPARCRRCGTRSFTRVRGRPRIDRCRACRTDHSVTAGTALHRLKVPIWRVLVTACLLARPESVSSNALARLFGTGWERAAFLAHRLRRAIAAAHVAFETLDASLETASVETRRDPGTMPKSLFDQRYRRPRLVIVALTTPQGDFVANVVERDAAMTAKHLVEDHLPGTATPRWQARAGWSGLASAVDVVYRTHHTVSQRWLRFYVNALGARSTKTPLHVLSDTLRAPPRPWRTLRPPRRTNPPGLTEPASA